MFEFFFKYPATVFRKGQFVLLGPWPAWALVAAVLAVAAVLLWHVRRSHGLLSGRRPLAVWGLQTAMAALILLLLWHPALSIATLRPQQNVIAVLVDDSRSMALKEGGATRLEQATALLRGGLLDSLGRKFQVRLYRFGKDLERVQKLEEVRAEAPASRLGASLKQAMAEAATLPLGAVVVLSDGADNLGGIDRETISEIRRRRVPVHTVGFGKERFERDLEIREVSMPARALVDSKLNAEVTFQQWGLQGERARLTVRDGAKVLAERQVVLGGEGAPQTESVIVQAASAGPKNLEVAIEPLSGEENRLNNAVNRLVHVQNLKPRILYLEGEPRWEFKFIRRAAGEDRSLELVSMLRTTQNKIYRQGIAGPQELEGGFPARAEELFAYHALIIGGLEASYFTPAQQELIRQFADRRGGGVLFLGGRTGLGDGGWGLPPVAEMLPVRLPEQKGTFRREPAVAELTPLGRLSLICRLEDDPGRNAERWKRMPALADSTAVGEAKPGAVVLMEAVAQKHRSPLLAMQNYGRGRTAVFATTGSWRWQMGLDHRDLSHEMFWQQLLRYLVSETPGQVRAAVPRPVLSDETLVRMRVEARDQEHRPLAGARVEARVIGPKGPQTVELRPEPLEEGVYQAEWAAEAAGDYIAEVVTLRDEKEIGRDVLALRREDGVAENFRAQQNRELLENLAEQTGGRYYSASGARQLPGEISYSEAGITTRETRDLWNMPALFLLALLLRGSEWVLRRKWGVV